MSEHGISKKEIIREERVTPMANKQQDEGPAKENNEREQRGRRRMTGRSGQERAKRSLPKPRPRQLATALESQ